MPPGWLFVKIKIKIGLFFTRIVFSEDFIYKFHLRDLKKKKKKHEIPSFKVFSI